jgi:hypothetical protein
MLGAFALSWALRDVPLRETAQAPVESAGETFAVPSEEDAERELEPTAG